MPIFFASVRQFFTDTIPFSNFVLLLTVLLTLLFPVTGLTAQQVEQQPQTSDVRVLIDVSGSMKKNDPANLRLPALRLLVGLLPPDSTAGVWTFGTRAEPLIRPGVTNDKWKAEARKASTKIHSKDMFTNIGLALEAAIADWGDKPSCLPMPTMIFYSNYPLKQTPVMSKRIMLNSLNVFFCACLKKPPNGIRYHWLTIPFLWMTPLWS